MYLLLIIYSITNLNVVSWGTREKKEKKTKKQLEEEKKAAEIAQKNAKKKGIWGALKNGNTDGFSLGSIFQNMCCTSKKDTSKVDERLDEIANTLEILKKGQEHFESCLTIIFF